MQNIMILNPENEKQSRREFQEYIFRVMYGDNLLMGRDIVNEYKDNPEDGE